MSTRYGNLGAKETVYHCIVPTYAPQLAKLSATPSREVPAFHASGTPGGGPGMRGMHHTPATPPTSQDIKQPPTHLPPQSHPMPPQSGGQMMQCTMAGAGRGNNQQAPFYNPQRGPSGVQRMAPHPRTPVLMSNNPQPFIHQQPVQPVYPGSLVSPVSGQPPVFVTSHVNQSFPIQTQPRHQGGYYTAQQFVIPQPHHMFPNSFQPMFYQQPIPQISRHGGPAPSSQGTAHPQPQPGGMTVIAGATGTMVTPPTGHQPPIPGRPKNVVPIIHPVDGRNILDDLSVDDNTPPKSGESSARQTPQSSTDQKTDQGVAAEFATRVAIAARSDQSGSPNSPALQQSSSRASNYSENESQASPDTQGMSTPSVSPSKLDISVESISSENQIVENSMTYDANQQATMIRPGWPQVMTPVELMPMSNYSGLIISDDMMRGGAAPNQPPREYQTVPTQWIPEASPVPVPVIISKDPSVSLESPVRPERVTPVVSALAQGPTVDIGPRHQREQFPALVKGHQQASPIKRKQRSDSNQEQTEAKSKDQSQQQAQSSQPQRSAAQSKPKSITPTTEIKKQSMPPSQESDDYVQSIQTRNSESKTNSIKKIEADSSESKVKSNDSLANKENNNVETRTSAEETVQEFNNNNNNRNKSELVKPEVVAMQPVEDAPETTQADTSQCTSEPEAWQKVPSAITPTIPDSEVRESPVPAAEETEPSKANGETVTEEAKQSNPKQKSGNKRQAQSKMRLEKEAKAAEQPESPANEAGPVSAVPETKIAPPPAPVNSGQPETQFQEETVPDEEKEKEDLMVAAKNEENNKQTASLKTNDATHSPVIENVNKAVLKHTYKQDQWSPVNPDGKKKYDRDFIMDLKNDPQSRRRPENLPNLDLLKDTTKQRPSDRNFLNAMSRDSSDNLFPTFGNKNSSQRSSQLFQKKGSQTNKPRMTKPPVIHMSLHQDVKLHETENAWKPARNADYKNMTEEEIKTDDLVKRVRSVLNKLTPEKFETLVNQVKALQIDTHSRLARVIDLVFEKAVDEPSFSVAYAEMCSNLQNIQVACDEFTGDGAPKQITFKKLLLWKCQQEFEKDPSVEIKRKKDKTKEIEMETDPEKKKALQIQFEEDERRIRMKSVGNSRFIGELYKLKLLTCNIMHECVLRLLNAGDEERLECLCKLLTTVGESLENKANTSSQEKDKDKEKENAFNMQEFNNYFRKLTEITKRKGSKKVSSRVRFMIQDLIDLRNNKWVPRRGEANPKKIGQIQKDAERENLEMTLALNSPQERNKRQDSRNSMDNRKRGVADGSGWMTVQSQNRSRYPFESSKLKLNQSEVEVGSSVSLGHRNQFVMWGQGLGGSKLDDKKVSQLDTNMFAALNDKMSLPNSRNSSLKGSSLSDKDRMFGSFKSSYDDDMRSSRSGSQQGPDSRSSSRDSVSSKSDDRRYMSNSSVKGHAPSSKPSSMAASNPISEPKPPELVEMKAKFLLDEYLNCLDFQEVEHILNKDLVDFPRKEIITNVCLAVLEMSGSKPKRSVGKLMSHLIKKNFISKTQYLACISTVLEAADDLALDMPLIWAYLAEIMVDVLAEENLNFRELADLLKPRRGSPEVAKLLASLLNLLLADKGESWIHQRWILDQVPLSDMIREKDVENFTKQNKVEFLLKETDLDNLNMDTIKSALYKMIALKTSCDKVTAWILKNVSPDKRSKPQFVRALMTALLEATVSMQCLSYKFDTVFFSNYEQLIIKYTDHSEELELPCLFAVQAYIHKLDYPQGLVSIIFDHLWDRELIATESFKMWRDSKDPQEQEGHAVCSKSLTSFFTLLDETLTDENSSDDES